MEKTPKAFKENVCDMSKDELEDYISTSRQVLFLLKEEEAHDKYNIIYQEFISDLKKLTGENIITVEEYEELIEGI